MNKVEVVLVIGVPKDDFLHPNHDFQEFQVEDKHIVGRAVAGANYVQEGRTVTEVPAKAMSDMVDEFERRGHLKPLNIYLIITSS